MPIGDREWTGHADTDIRRWHRGHIYPALAVARELQARYDAEILYLGDANGLETQMVPARGLPMRRDHRRQAAPLFSLRTFTDLGRIPVGMMQALRHVQAFKPMRRLPAVAMSRCPPDWPPAWRGRRC